MFFHFKEIFNASRNLQLSMQFFKYVNFEDLLFTEQEK